MEKDVRRGGIDLGGTKIQAVVVDGRHAVLGQERRPTPTTGGPGDVVRELAAALKAAAASAGCDPASLEAVGVGAPGATDQTAGTLAHAGNLPGWEKPYPLSAKLSEEIGAPVVLGNDVGVAVEAEYHLGAGRPYSSLLGVWWGTGVGGGLIFDGEHWLGRGAAGEFGHMVVKLGGAAEPKGLVGTVEAYAGRASMEARARRAAKKGSKTKLFKLMEKHGRTRLSSGVWADALEKRDRLAVKLVDRAVEILGAGIASAVNLLDIEGVVVGGGLGSRLGAPYVDRIAVAMRPHLLVKERPPAVHVAKLGDLGGAIGAALLAEKKHPQGAQVSSLTAL